MDEAEIRAQILEGLRQEGLLADPLGALAISHLVAQAISAVDALPDLEDDLAAVATVIAEAYTRGRRDAISVAAGQLQARFDETGAELEARITDEGFGIGVGLRAGD
jgi:hypothetical protein